MSEDTALENLAPKRKWTWGNVFFAGFLALVFICVVSFVSSYDSKQELAHCGIRYAIEPGASPSLSFVRFWIESDQGQIDGPAVVAENPHIEVATLSSGAPSVTVTDGHTLILAFKAIMGPSQPSKATGFDIEYRQPGG